MNKPARKIAHVRGLLRRQLYQGEPRLEGPVIQARIRSQTASPAAEVESEPPDVRRGGALADRGGDGGLDRRGLGDLAEVIEQERRRQDRPERIGLPGARVLRRRAVDGLEHRDPARMEVARGRHPEPPLQRRPEVRRDVAEHVVRDDHLELARVLDHLHAERVDVEVRGLDVRILARDLGETSAATGRPRIASRSTCRTSRPAGGRGPRANSKAYRMIRSTPLRVETSSCTATSSGGPLLQVPARRRRRSPRCSRERRRSRCRRAENPLQGTEPVVEAAHGPVVHVEVELEARAEQDVGRVLHVGDARVAEGPHEDRRRSSRDSRRSAPGGIVSPVFR